MRTVPTSIQTSAYELSVDGIASLYQLSLKSGAVFYLAPKTTISWQGNLYEAIPCSLGEMQIEADGKANRPSFSFANPAGIFTSSVQSGALNNATLLRRRILYDDLINNRNFSITEAMLVAQVMSVTKNMIVLQLRDVHDAHDYMLPARAYMPPEFPHVKL